MNDPFEQLISAAAAAVEVLDDPGAAVEDVNSALTALRIAVRGALTDTPVELPQADRHLLSRLDRDAGGPSSVPIGDEVVRIQRQLEEAIAPADGNGIVVTELRGMIIGGLLHELAARLRPGAAFGPGTAGQPLADIATQLADAVLDQTFVGRR